MGFFKALVFLTLFINSLFASNIYATFEVEAKKSADLAFSASGIIDDVLVDIGSVVKKDETLAKLDNGDTKALLEVYKTTLKFAKKDFERQQKIKNIIDKEKFDAYAKAYESAKAQVVYQQKLFDKTILKAPFDGVILTKELEKGDVVSGQVIKTAFKIQSVKSRKLVLKFDQKYHDVVKVGDIFRYKLDGSDKEYEGTISKIYPYADKTTRKISAEVEADDLLTGLFGEGYIINKE